VQGFLKRVLELGDDQRLAVAEARRAVNEAFHETALRAAAEALAGRGEAYARARRALARAHVPECLDGSPGDEADRAGWQDVARLVQLAIDDALLAVLTSDALHPNHSRELYRSFKAASKS
jgi:hypothetical protein